MDQQRAQHKGLHDIGEDNAKERIATFEPPSRNFRRHHQGREPGYEPQP
jgi:hypothetical protein